MHATFQGPDRQIQGKAASLLRLIPEREARKKLATPVSTLMHTQIPEEPR